MNDLEIRFASNEVSPKAKEDQVRIPIIGSIAADLPLPELDPTVSHLSDNEARTVEIARALLPTKSRGVSLFALEVKGESMRDALINNGDIVILKPASVARNGEMVAVWLPRDNEATLRYFFAENDHYRLQPAHPEMKPIFLRKDEHFEIKGKVVMVIRRVERV